MKLPAIKKAESRLVKATEALERAEKSKSYEEFESAWSDFLISCAAIFNILNAGTKGNNKSSAWFGLKKGERRKDPLLQYLHHARDAEEHGIEPVTGIDPGALIFGRNLKGTMFLQGVEREGNTFRIKAAISDPRDAENIVSIKPPSPKLVPAHDTRHGNVYPVPTSHLGNKLEDSNPLTIARLGLEYHREMVAQAKSKADLEQ